MRSEKRSLQGAWISITTPLPTEPYSMRRTWPAWLMPILMRFFGKFRLAPAFLLLAALACPPATAQDMPSEQSLRAAMVFNFLKFTEFPPEVDRQHSADTLVYRCRGSRQAEALLALSGRKAWSRELVVVHLAGRGDDCHVLYVDSSQRWNAIEATRPFPHASRSALIQASRRTAG